MLIVYRTYDCNASPACKQVNGTPARYWLSTEHMTAMLHLHAHKINFTPTGNWLSTEHDCNASPACTQDKWYTSLKLIVYRTYDCNASHKINGTPPWNWLSTEHMTAMLHLHAHKINGTPPWNWLSTEHMTKMLHLHAHKINGTPPRNWLSTEHMAAMLHLNAHKINGTPPRTDCLQNIWLQCFTCMHTSTFKRYTSQIQATLFISKSRGPDKILRVISSLR